MVLSLFSFVLQINYKEKKTKGQIEQIKTCRKKQHVRIDNVKEMSDLICGKSAVGGNYNSTRDTLTMVLKHTRNWYAHGRIEKLGLKFCQFIFLVSIRIIYCNSGKCDVRMAIESYIGLDDEDVVEADEELYKQMLEDINQKIIDEDARTQTYTINIDDLFYKYSNENVRTEIQLSIEDLYRMFILCLHFPSITSLNSPIEIIFNKIENQEKYINLLENIAMKGFEE